VLVGLIIAVVGVAATVWGIFKGIENVFVEENYERKVVMYPSRYKLGDKDILVTAINVGKPLIIRKIYLIVGWVAIPNPISRVFSTNLQITFDILGDAPLFAGCERIDSGSVLRISHEEVKQALMEVNSFFKDDLQKHEHDYGELSPQVYIAMSDRFLEEYPREEKQHKGILLRELQGLISICSLGDFNLLLQLAQSKEGMKFFEAALEFHGDSEKGFVPARMTRYIPPISASEEEYEDAQMKNLREIIKKLDSIQKTLNEKKNIKENSNKL
jgi:hypothetical protein